ncbi:MAG: MmcQ/YjbR family DNA-binding protein [Taibaiella sp.]|nr:MmcQ/YjbR family DNA-binding protein [Taibaiella sp.]
MTIGELTDHCASKADVEECFPFDEDTLVFKVKGKMFFLMGLSANPLQFNVKCDPEKAVQLREQFDCVQPGYHMNKKHWNTVVIDGSLDRRTIREIIDHSYELVVNGGKKAK